jgi:hypothetical protein
MIAFEQHPHRSRKTSRCQCINDLHISYEPSSELHVLLHTEHNTQHAITLAFTSALLHETMSDAATTMILTNVIMKLASYSAMSKFTNIYSVPKHVPCHSEPEHDNTSPTKMLRTPLMECTDS